MRERGAEYDGEADGDQWALEAQAAELFGIVYTGGGDVCGGGQKDQEAAGEEEGGGEMM